MPRKQTQRDLRRLEKAEKAAQLEKVVCYIVFFFMQYCMSVSIDT